MKVCVPVAGQTNRCLAGGSCLGSQTNCWKTPLHAYPDVNAPNHDFTFSPARPAVNAPVQFTDRTLFSGGGPNSWIWNFGDTQTSTNQNPTHAYTVEGTYQATLTTNDGAGYACTSSSKSIPVGKSVPTWKEVLPR